MPAWRAFQYIDRAIQSVVDQNLQKPFELIIVDDGSDDGNRTWQKIQSWERTIAKHPFLSIKTTQLTRNAGPGAARHVAIEMSSGKYICYLDIDDEFYPSRVLGALRMFQLRVDDTMDIVLSPYVIVDAGKRFIYNPHYVMSKIHESLQKRNVCIPLGVMHTKEIYDRTTGWPKYLVCGEDGILWRRMSEAGAKFTNCGFKAGIYHIRIRGQSRTQRRFDNGMTFAFKGDHPEGTHGQYLDNLTDEELSQFFEQ